MLKSLQRFWIITIVICLILGAFFSYIYFQDHAWGTWGDDSAGYIYLWGKMDQNKDLVYQEPLTVAALKFFGNEKLARWTTPTHHEIISPSGYVASKYPIGLSQIMLLFSRLFQDDKAIYYVLPLLATINLILVYLISLIFFKDIKYKHFFSLLPAFMLGLASLYYNYAISQPMREIPSMFFLLAGYLFLLLAVEYYGSQNQKKDKIFFYTLIILASLFAGYSLNVRETSIMILPAFLIMLFSISNRNAEPQEKNKNIKFKIKLALLALLMLIIAYIPSFINSADITQFKEKFRAKDITSIAITSNFDHISSFSLQNVFNNQGKFRPGRGALPHYWGVMNDNLAVWPCFIVLAIIGLYSIYKKNKWLSASLLLWILGVLIIFSLWINPYSRYILPLFPILAICGSYGLYAVCFKIVPHFFKNKRLQFLVCLIILLSLIISYLPAIIDIKTNFNENEDGEEKLVFKAISENDLFSLKGLGEKIYTDNKTDKPPLVVFSGTWQYGISETFEAHTGIQGIHMPLEDKKNVFDKEQVKDFFTQEVFPNYNVYFWIDATSKSNSVDFINYFKVQPKYSYSLTFANPTIYGN
ncbi:MAG: hypothetical protein V1898_01555 [Patescibacteria group bacterium]